ncbi:MAG: cupredoxin domain-containing protein [Polyangiales bacterium]
MKSTAALTLSLLLAAGCRETPTTSQPNANTNVATSRVAVAVDAQGYHPASINLPAGRPATIVFTRTSDEGCGQQVVFPSLNIRRDLPLNRPVEVALTPSVGTIAFTCGMNMLRGSIVAQ